MHTDFPPYRKESWVTYGICMPPALPRWHGDIFVVFCIWSECYQGLHTEQNGGCYLEHWNNYALECCDSHKYKDFSIQVWILFTKGIMVCKYQVAYPGMVVPETNGHGENFVVLLYYFSPYFVIIYVAFVGLFCDFYSL